MISSMSLFFLLVFSLCFAVIVGEFRLQLLHNNDLHSRFEQTNVYSAPCPPDGVKKGQCFGGFARLKTAIRQAVEEANRHHIPSIVLNAGDTFQGTPYYMIKKWHIVAPLLDMLSHDVMTLGNHEFDDGIENLAAYLKEVKTPVVVCNLNLTLEPRLILPNVTPSKVLTVNDVKIGVIGYLTPETMALSKTEKLEILDEVACIQAEARRLKKNGVNIIIGLGHSGFDQDVHIAKQIPELSLIVGGHSHTLLYSPKDRPPSAETPKEVYPYMVTQASGKRVPVVQAYAYTKYLGKLLLVFDDDGNVLSAEGNPQLLDYKISENAEMQKLINFWVTPLRDELKMVKGYTRFPLLLSNFLKQQYESNLANLITDAIVDYGIRRSANLHNDKWTSASIAFINMGAIRCELENQEAITLEDILMMIPFGNVIYEVRYRGAVIKAALEHSVTTRGQNDFPYYLYFSGLRVTYDLSKAIGDRVQSVKVLCTDCSTPQYKSLGHDTVYTVLIGDYLMNGGHGFEMFRSEKINVVNLGIKDTDIMITFIEKARLVYPVLDGRIIVKGSHSQTATSRATAATNACTIFLYLFFLSLLDGRYL